ncbi:hypothetical protein BGZ88_002172, partial [Linnemannia elongata]
HPAQQQQNQHNHNNYHQKQHKHTQDAFLLQVLVLQEPDRLGRHHPCPDPPQLDPRAAYPPGCQDDPRGGPLQDLSQHDVQRRRWSLRPL